MCIRDRNDLNLLVEKGYLNTVGQGSHKVYVRADNKEVTESVSYTHLDVYKRQM